MVRYSDLAKYLLILAACMAIGACSGRSKRAIAVEPAPSTAVEPPVGPGPTGFDPGQTTPLDNGFDTSTQDLDGDGIPDDQQTDDSILDNGVDTSTTPPGSTNPPPGSTNPPPGSTNPPPGSTNPPPGSTNPPPGTTPPGSTNVQLDVTLDNGQSTTIQWDGQSFKGNSRWDVVPVP